jgi:hypothetical protein
MTALDWIGAVVASFGALFCFQFPFFSAPAFGKMFQDFGGALPAITQLGLTVWFPLLLGIVPASLLGLALAGPFSLAARRGLIVGAFLLSIVVGGVCLYAMYAPIWALAGAIK